MTAALPVENIARETHIPPALTVITPMALIERAMTSGANMEIIQKFVDLQKDWDERQSIKAFEEAVAKAKCEIQPIARNATGHNNKKYADFAAVTSAIDPILGRHGLSYRFETDQSDKSITVTCILFGHGHRIPASKLTGAPDTSGNKNGIQAIGSTLTYLQRYSLMLALGLAASNDDDGKASAGAATITQEQADNLRDLIEANGKDKAKFLKWAKAERIEDIRADYYDSCVDTIKAPVRK